MNRYQEQIKELTLLLLYLNSWEEKLDEYNIKYYRAWKTYPFNVLDELANNGFLEKQKYKKNIKSVVLTEKGVEKAKELFEKYLKKL